MSDVLFYSLGFGKFFPNSVRSLSQTTTTTTIIKHITSKCTLVPINVKVRLRLYTYHSTNSYTPPMIDLLISLFICHRISSRKSCMQPKKRISHRMHRRNLTSVGQSTDHGRNSFNVCGIGCMPPQEWLRVALPSLTRELSLPQVLAFVSRLTKWFFSVVVQPLILLSFVPIQLSIPLPLLWMIRALEALLIMMSTIVELFVTYRWSSTISRDVIVVHSLLYLLQGRSQRPRENSPQILFHVYKTLRQKDISGILTLIVNNLSELSLIPFGH